MASHTLPFPSEKPNPIIETVRVVAGVTGALAGVLLALPFIALDRALARRLAADQARRDWWV